MTPYDEPMRPWAAGEHLVTRRLWRPQWRLLRRRVADLEQRVAALEAGRPRIVQVSGDRGEKIPRAGGA
jgi:hypothetical protein